MHKSCSNWRTCGTGMCASIRDSAKPARHVNPAPFRYFYDSIKGVQLSIHPVCRRTRPLLEIDCRFKDAAIGCAAWKRAFGSRASLLALHSRFQQRNQGGPSNPGKGALGS